MDIVVSLLGSFMLFVTPVVAMVLVARRIREDTILQLPPWIARIEPPATCEADGARWPVQPDTRTTSFDHRPTAPRIAEDAPAFGSGRPIRSPHA